MNTRLTTQPVAAAVGESVSPVVGTTETEAIAEMGFEFNGVPAAEWVIFDPTDIPRLFAQDEAIERQWTDGLNVPAALRSDERLATEVVALRNACKLPFGDRFKVFIATQGSWLSSDARMMDSPTIGGAL